MFEPTTLPGKIAHDWPPAEWSGRTVVIAVSGGADSVALLRSLDMLAQHHSAATRWIVAHMNHAWRAEADAEQQFVEQLAERLGMVCEVGRGERSTGGRGQGAEMLARSARYQFLTDVARCHAARHVVTAHTADDQAETVLHRILRGTGLKGLRGIPRRRLLADDVLLVRPMLSCWRREVEDYLKSLGQDYCHDATNHSLAYTRNRLRHQLLPHLRRRYNTHVDRALIDLAELADQANRTAEQLVEQLWEKSLVKQSPTEVHLRRALLYGSDAYLVGLLLVEIWHRQRWPRRGLSRAALSALAARLRDPETSALRQHVAGGVDVQIDGDHVVLRRVGD